MTTTKRGPRSVARALLATLLVAMAAPAPGAASEPKQAARLSEADAELVAQVEAYLSGVDTLHARFRQVSSNGGRATGELWLDRPGKLRFEYDPPHPLLLVSNGRFLLHYDRELEQTSYVPISRTPLWFLIRERIDLSRAEDYALAGVSRSAERVVLHVVRDGAEPGEPGSIAVLFRRDPLQLAAWRIVDQQGITTTVRLENPAFGVDVAAKRFDFGELDLPEPGRRPENRGR